MNAETMKRPLKGELEALVRDMHALLGRMCDASECGSCPLMGEGLPCDLGAVDERMVSLGLIEVNE